jgi:type IV pilus assembly protein PilQ
VIVRADIRKEKRMATHVFLAAALIAGASLARTAAAVKVTSVEEKGGKLFIHATAKPEFTVFKLSGPPRVVIDLNGGDVTALVQSRGHQRMVSPGDALADRARIAGWSAAQFDEGETRVGRIVVTLQGEQKYDVSTEGTDVVLTVGEPVPAPSPAPADPDVVLSRVDVQEVGNPAHKLGQITVTEKGGVAVVHVGADGGIAKFGILELKNPARLALDLHGVAGKFSKAGGALLVKGVRTGKTADGVRVVIDGEGDTMARYRIARANDGLRVLVGEPKEVATVPAPPLRPEPEVRLAQPEAAKISAGPKLVQIRAVDLRTLENRTEVLVALDEAVRFEVSRPDATTSVLTLHGAALPDRLERNLDASSLGGPVTMLSSYRVPGGLDVKVVATVAKGTLDEMTAQKGTLIWKFGGPKPVAQATTAAPRAAAMASEARAAASQTSVYDASNYTGRKVDFNVKDIDIKNLLGAIAEISKKNIIVADDVRGTVTIKLRNVPWDQALDIVLKSKGLGREDIGNIIRVAPIETLRAEQKSAAEAYKNRQAAEPLKVRLIPVNYAKAEALTAQLKDALTERGSVSVDPRTNTLIVKDVQDALLRAEGIVRNLDTQTPEVLIEARIVEAATSFSRQAGIQWGGNVSMAPTFGNPTGLIFPNILAVAGAADDAAAPIGGLTGVTTPNFAVNMPAPIGLNNGGGLGFVFGSAGGAANLNLRLSAAENSGTIKTISSPRVVTVDNVDASISQGVSIPFSQTSAAGVSTAFIEARLELRVNPHVTQEGSIQMRIQATNNQPNPQLTGSNGQPSISRREARTEVLVRDGETTVIGGIYTRRNSEAWNEVPVLSKIPVLGWLFKKKAITDDRTELLVFITPRIVNRSQSVVAAAPSAGDEGKQ